jgi:NTE family protein
MVTSRLGAAAFAALVWGLTGALSPALAESADQAAGTQPLGEPKIVLVLSGGGARAAGHIGVLKVLEESRIPIHGIVGTSMGAVVGGLYAAGHSPADMERLVARVDWQELFIDDPPREAFRFRRKREDASLFVQAASGVDAEGLKLPKGVLHGHRLKAFLARQTLHVGDVDDFSQLSVPFVSVATDISTGEAVELTGGNLAEAMFASLAIPAFVGPTEIDGRLLVDGGVSNNLPVDVALAMDADVIIAVDLSSPLRGRDELGSVLEVTDQLTSILTRRNTTEQIARLRPQDVLIVPELGEVTAIDFDLAATTIPSAYRAALAARPRLTSLALPQESFNEHIARMRRDTVTSVNVAEVVLTTDSGVDKELLLARTGLRPGTIEVTEIENAVDELYGMELFSQVPYAYQSGKLHINPVRRDWGPNYLQFGLALEDNLEGRNHYNLGVAFTATELNAKAGEWRTELGIGERPRLVTEFYQPFGPEGRWYFNPSVGVRAFNRGVFQMDDLVAEYQIRQAGGTLATGYAFGSRAEARIGLSLAEGTRRRLIGDPTFEKTSADSGMAFVEFRYDSLDDLYFPGRGSTLEARWTLSEESLGADVDYRAAELAASRALSLGRHTLLVGGEFATVYEGEAPFHEQYNLGGFLNLSGLEVDQKLGQHRGVGRLVYYYRWSSNPVLPVYLGMSAEAGQVWLEEDEISFGSLEAAGSLFLGLDSPIGPVFLAGGLAEGGNKSIYVFLGQPF